MRNAVFDWRFTARLVVVLPATILSACASDYEPRNNAPVSAETYQSDLDSCQSSATAARAAGGAEGFLVGALWGAANGAAAGAHHGGADIGAIVGASVGAVVGFVQGLTWSRGSSVSYCMHAKGYRRV
ncbi:MAG TPA: hypothetical protein VGQ35_02200 [Dongiaceae bacterium]|nr:hypothetical protein [Dongiaceae bacterium]